MKTRTILRSFTLSVIGLLLVQAASAQSSVSNMNGDAGTYHEEDPASAIDVGGNATFTTSDIGLWNAGYYQPSMLEVYISANSSTSDIINITDAGGITTTSGYVYYNGVEIAMFLDGGPSGGNNMRLSFASGVTAAAISALLHNFTFENTSNQPSVLTRTITFRFRNKNNAVFDVTTTMAVTAFNDPPTISATTTLSGIANSPVTLTSVTASDPEEGSSNVTISFGVSDGTFSALNGTGVTVTGSGSASLMLTGSYGALRTYLGGNPVTFTSTTNGVKTITVTTNDGGHTGSGGNKTASTTINVTVSPAVPKVLQVTSNAINGTYSIGQNIDVRVEFDAAIILADGLPTLLLETGTTDRLATYTGNVGNTLVFNYIIQEGDVSADLEYQSTAALTLPAGATLKSPGGTDAELTLPALGGTSSISGQKALVIDGIRPTVTSVTVPANGIYVGAQVLEFTVNFSEAVNVTAPAGIDLQIGSTSKTAAYFSGTGTSSVVYRYTVTAGDLDTDGIGIIVTPSGNTIKDMADNDLGGTLNNIGSTTGVRVDAVAPSVNSVTLPANKTYITNEQLNFTVNFSEPVNVTGTPAIALTIGSTNVNASYVSGSGTNALLFRYTVTAGELDNNGITVGALTGTIADAATNAANLSLGTLNTSGILVDAVAPVVNSVAVPANDTYITSETLSFTVNFSEAVNITGTPSLGITIGSTNVSATYFSGNGTSALIFNYTVLANQEDGNGITVGALTGTIKDVPGNDAVLTLNNTGSTSGVYVDAITPVVTSVAVPANATYLQGQTLTFTVNFSENVAVTGTPQLALTIGSTNVNATYASGTGTSALVFNYTVAAGNLDLDGIAINSLSGTIADVPGNPADLTLNNVASAANVWVDAVLPVITNVSVPANGTYVAGDQLDFTVTFSEAVNLTGASNLTVIIGSNTVNATYVSGSSSNNLLYRYTVVAGDEDTDGIALGTLSGDIKDNATNNAQLLLMNVGNTSLVLVDAIVPVVTAVNVPANKAYVAGEVLQFSVTFSENVNVTATPTLQVQIGSTNVNAGYVSGTGSNSLVFTYTVLVGQEDTDGITVNTLTGDVEDLTGNDAVLTLNNIGSTTQVLVDAVAPVVTSVAVPADKRYKAGEFLDFTVAFSEPLVKTGVGEPSLGFTAGAANKIADYTGTGAGNSYTFRYTVVAGDLDTDGIALATTLQLNTSILKDAASNNLVTTLTGVPSTSAVLVDAVAPVIAAGQTFNINENSAVGTAVGTATGSDAFPLQAWTITAGNTNNAFAINAATGAITVNNATALDYETITSYTLTLTVSDGLNTSAPVTVTININNLPEPPTSISLSANSIFENNAVNAIVGAFSATSTEPGATFTYTLVAGTGSADNSAFAITGTNLTAAQSFNYEAKSIYNIRVRATTQAGEFLDREFVVNIGDVNETPTLGAISNVALCATASEQIIALNGVTPGPETSQTLSFTVTSDNPALFSQLTADMNGVHVRFVNGATGTAIVTLTVKDNGGIANGGVDQVSNTFVLSVTSITPPTITSSEGLNISKGINTVLTASGGVTYTWDATSPGIISGINTANLTVRATQNAVYRVTAYNAAGCPASADISLTVKDDYKVDATNFMSPNGDGVNDRFIIKNIDTYPLNEVKIFDRTGRMIYAKKGYMNEWDARISGRPVEEGTYYYILDFGPGLPKVKGFITVVRDK
ncbi:gliding motility-associated C-terminal domain-containing protein [uncultured Chitinophaga sp.]|uniref:T9SS type B sorting domain-containing protein n=1 Tax=uncultured Chitinophaga sp. TaxID=339340 RepID=UPI0025E2880B|nr:gliding motility-associated C-terminal domain-containing protein [uncultured Chitinophaga sp.]